ncbi:MAG: hypothetical protein A3I66_19380 [Burkholderiales bacterium RIFCSPLOWO2_02_FULL_57_36]|nr:MAG: hypothetical protein A3I66_19380 [Burkholderiales bacterium RIFCSPLOWO2_02_FULL_57_36]
MATRLNFESVEMTDIFPSSLLLVLCMITLSAEAQIYKWVDANGKTQYGDAPPQSRKVKPEVIRTTPTQNSSEQTPDWEQKNRDFQRRRIEQDAMKPKEETASTSQHICASARRKMQNLDGKLVYRLDKNGQRSYMEDDERAAIENKAQQDIANHCPR